MTRSWSAACRSSGTWGFVPGDFADERDLNNVADLVERSSERDADKATKWRHITEEQGRVFVNLVSDTE
jgi:hypothetical protein